MAQTKEKPKSDLIRGIEKQLQGLNNPVLSLMKGEPMAEKIKKEIVSYYKSKVKIVEDTDAYHLHIIK